MYDAIGERIARQSLTEIDERARQREKNRARTTGQERESANER